MSAEKSSMLGGSLCQMGSRWDFSHCLLTKFCSHWAPNSDPQAFVQVSFSSESPRQKASVCKLIKQNKTKTKYISLFKPGSKWKKARCQLLVVIIDLSQEIRVSRACIVGFISIQGFGFITKKHWIHQLTLCLYFFQSVLSSQLYAGKSTLCSCNWIQSLFWCKHATLFLSQCLHVYKFILV